MACQTLYTLNALTLLIADERPDYAEVLRRADLVVADGVGVVWAIRKLTGLAVERVTGIDLIDDLCRVCCQEGQSVYLLGGKPGVAAAAGQRLLARFPGLRVVGARDGFWSPAEEHEVVAAINACQPGLLLVGLGQPRQEQFLDRHRDRLRARLAMGCGGSFDVLAGRVKRAPGWMRAAGLEWFFRLLQEPWRLRRVAQLPRFVWMILTMK